MGWKNAGSSHLNMTESLPLEVLYLGDALPCVVEYEAEYEASHDPWESDGHNIYLRRIVTMRGQFIEVARLDPSERARIENECAKVEHDAHERSMGR